MKNQMVVAVVMLKHEMWWWWWWFLVVVVVPGGGCGGIIVVVHELFPLEAGSADLPCLKKAIYPFLIVCSMGKPSGDSTQSSTRSASG